MLTSEAKRTWTLESGTPKPQWTTTEGGPASSYADPALVSAEPGLDELVQFLGEWLEAPMAGIHLLGERGYTLKGGIGLSALQSRLADSPFCAEVLRAGRTIVVPDATLDERFAQHALVREPPHVAWYAGAVLKSTEAVPLGTVFVMDGRPREALAARDLRLLEKLAAHVVQVLELRNQVQRQDSLIALQRRSLSNAAKLRDDYQRLWEGMSEGFGVLSPELRVLRANPAASRIFGMDEAELLAHTVPERWEADEETPVIKIYRAVLQDGLARSVEQKVPLPDGGSRWVRFRVQRVREGLAVFSQDISEHRRTTRALRVTEERLAATFRHASVGICELDEQARFVRINQALCRLLGRSLPEAMTLGFTEVVHPEDREQLQLLTRKTLETGEPYSLEHRYQRGDGGELWAETHVARVQDPRGNPLGIFAIVSDMTERKQAEARLRQLGEELAHANRRQSEFLAVLAHELRNPLAPIRNGLQVMRLSAGNGEVVAQMQDMIDRQVTQMVHLIDDLLDVARITNGRLALRKAPVLLQTLIQNAVEASEPVISTERHQLEVSVPEAPLLLDADPTRIVQVICNLLNNAAKYTAPGGRITLIAKRENHEAVISVTDTGVGLSPENLSEVFKLFAQVSPGRADRGGGLGIGLTLVRSLVQLHGGQVRAESAGLGQGTTFTVRLPLGETGTVTAPSLAPPTTAVPDRLTPLRIMIADDNRDAADSLDRYLRLKGHETAVTYDGTSALMRAPQFQPDLMFLDIGMPGLDGYELARQLRTHDALRRTVLVALTGWGMEEDRRRSEAAGFDAHLIKPADPAAVEALLAHVATREFRPACPSS